MYYSSNNKFCRKYYEFHRKAPFPGGHKFRLTSVYLYNPRILNYHHLWGVSCFCFWSMMPYPSSKDFFYMTRSPNKRWALSPDGKVNVAYICTPATSETFQASCRTIPWPIFKIFSTFFLKYNMVKTFISFVFYKQKKIEIF